jgi:acetolactate synthase I/II/III large subunit
VTGRALVPAGRTVVVSGFDPGGGDRGGVWGWDGGPLRALEPYSTTGLRMHAGALIRCRWNDSRRHADLLVTEPDGRSWGARVDGVGNPHDVLGDGEHVAVVATEQNEVVWFDRTGTRVRSWRAAGEPDSWHLNSLVRHGGRILVCAFGRFARRKEWDRRGRPASGCVVDLASGEVVLAGLRAPHTPRLVDGCWLVCNSADGELLAVGPDGTRVLARFDGWPRGLAVTPHAVHVGVSPPRHQLDRADAPSRVVSLDRRSWRVLAEVEVPAREVYDLELVPTSLLGALSAPEPALTRIGR